MVYGPSGVSLVDSPRLIVADLSSISIAVHRKRMTISPKLTSSKVRPYLHVYVTAQSVSVATS